MEKCEVQHVYFCQKHKYDSDFEPTDIYEGLMTSKKLKF